MNNPLDIDIRGTNFRIYYEEDRFINDIIKNNEYKDVFNDLVVIDLGCNIGAFSLWIYEYSKIIYAIDPAPENIELLNQTATYNNLSKLRTFVMAISGGGMREIDDQHSPSGGSWKLTNGTQAQHMVPTQTIGQFMDSQNIEYVDILKIDVEGAEEEIFESSSFGEVAPRIKTIIGEYHNGKCPTKRLEALGYRVTDNKDCSKFVARRK